MKKYLAIILALMLIPASALAADVKISELPEATTMSASDLFVIVDVGTNTTKKITATNFFANIPAPFTFNTGGDSYIQFETNTTYNPSSGYHLYVEGGVFKLYDGAERTIFVSGQTLALGAQDLTMTGSLAATGARVTKGWFTDVESTNMPTVGGTAILSSLTAPVFSTSIEAPFIVLGSAATAADAGTIRMPNAGTIMFEADAAGTDINALNVDSSEVINIGSAGASAIVIGDNTAQPKVRMALNATNETWSGNTLYFAQCAASMGFGQPAYIQSTGKPGLADADGAATMPAIGLVVVASTDADTPCTILTHGVITDTDWNWTPGNTIYVADGDAGAITATIGDISDENDVVQVVGIAIHADSIFVNPSLATAVLAAP